MLTKTYDLLNPETFANGVPHDVFDDLRANDPVHGQPNPYGGTIWHLTRYDDVRAASSDWATFSSDTNIVYSPTIHMERMEFMKGNVMFNDPPYHARLRGFAAKAFSPPVVAKFEDWIRGLCEKICDNVQALNGAPFDAVPILSAALPAEVIATILGVPDEDRAMVLKWVMTTMAEFDEEVGAEAATASLNSVLSYALVLREKKTKEPGVDMATQLNTPPPGVEPMTDDEYVHMVNAIANAGFETTFTLISQSLVLMAGDPKIQEALLTTDRKVIQRGIEECLRYITPAMYFGRRVTKDVEMRGKQLKEGDYAMLWFTAANRDPEAFEDPHRFNIDRPKKNHFSFGAGSPHFCIGNALARMEVDLLFHEFAKRGMKFKLADKPLRLPGNFVNALRKVPLQVVA